MKKGIIGVVLVVMCVGTVFVVNKVVNEVKKCDKSYKGHEAIAFGEGDHKLTYTVGGRKKHTVCYSFGK